MTSQNETTSRKLYDTLDAAKAEVPEGKNGTPTKSRIFRITHKGKEVGFAWATSVDGAIVVAARHHGYVAEVGERAAGGITPEKAAEKLADLTDAELAALGLKRAKKTK